MADITITFNTENEKDMETLRSLPFFSTAATAEEPKSDSKEDAKADAAAKKKADAKAKKEEKAAAKKKADAKAKAEAEDAEESEYSMDDVRALTSKKLEDEENKAEYKKLMKEKLKELGATKVPDLDPSKFGEFMTFLEEL